MNHPQRWQLLFAFSLILFIINIDYTAVNLALIPIATDLKANLNTIQWVLSGYMLGWVLLVIPGGKYADCLDKKFLYLLGLGLFLLASILAGLAFSPTMLITARILQGIAGGIYIPTVYALIYVIFAEQERGRAIGLLSLGVGLGMALGPFLGGVILSLINWRCIFFINIPIGLVAWWIVYRSQKIKTTVTGNHSAFSKLSVTMFGLSIALILYLLSVWQNWTQQPLFSFSLLISFIVILGLFLLMQWKTKNPLFPLVLFRNRFFMGTIIGILLEQYIFSTVMVSSGLYLQKVLHFSSFQSSLIYLFLSLIFGFIAVISGPWIDRIGLKKPTMIGFLVLALGSLGFIYLSESSLLWTVGIIFFTLGAGMGFAFAALNSGVVKTVEAEHIGIASSLFLVCALMGNALGVTFTTISYQFFGLKALLANVEGTGLSIGQVQQLSHFISDVGTKTPSLNLFDATLQSLIIDTGTKALTFGIAHAMLISFLLSILGFLSCIILWKQKSKAVKTFVGSSSREL